MINPISFTSFSNPCISAQDVPRVLQSQVSEIGQKLEELSTTCLQFTHVDEIGNKVIYHQELSSILTGLSDILNEKKQYVYELSYEGNCVDFILGLEDLKAICVGIKVFCGSLEEVYYDICAWAQKCYSNLSPVAEGESSIIQSVLTDHKLATIVIKSFPITLKLIAHQASLGDAFVHSGECLSIVNQGNKWDLQCHPKYDRDTALQFSKNKRFEVPSRFVSPTPQALFSYYEQWMKGWICLTECAEQRFLIDFSEAVFEKELIVHLSSYNDVEKKTAFLFTLEDGIFRLPLEELQKKMYQKVVNCFFADLIKEKAALIGKYLTEQTPSYLDSQDSLLEPRYLVALKDCFMYCTIPHSTLKILLRSKTEQSVKIAFRLLQSMQNVHVRVVRKIIIGGAQLNLVADAQTVFRKHFSEFKQHLYSDKLTTLMKCLPTDPLGLAEAPLEDVLTHITRFGVESTWKEIILKRLQELKNSNPDLLASVSYYNALKPFFLEALAEAIENQNYELTEKLFKKLGHTRESMLEKSWEMQSKMSQGFCLKLLKENKALTCAAPILAKIIQEEKDLSLFWERITELKVLSLEQKLEVLEALQEKDSDIQLWRSAFNWAHEFDSDWYEQEKLIKYISPEKQALLLKNCSS